MKHQTVCRQPFLHQNIAGFMDSEFSLKANLEFLIVSPCLQFHSLNFDSWKTHKSNKHQKWWKTRLPTTWKVLTCYLAASEATNAIDTESNLISFAILRILRTYPEFLTCISSKPMRLIGLAMPLTWSWNLFQGIPLQLAGSRDPQCAKQTTYQAFTLTELAEEAMKGGFNLSSWKGGQCYLPTKKRAILKLKKHPSPQGFEEIARPDDDLSARSVSECEKPRFCHGRFVTQGWDFCDPKIRTGRTLQASKSATASKLGNPLRSWEDTETGLVSWLFLFLVGLLRA